MSKLTKFLVLAFVGVLLFWLFTEPQGFANTIGIILGGLRTAAEQLIAFVVYLYNGLMGS